MPKKNSSKPNGFVLFANEIRNQLLMEGHSIRSMSDLIHAASPKWQQLPENEKEYYKEKAKWDWENRHKTGGNKSSSGPTRPSRRDGNGYLMTDHVDLVKVNEEKRKKEREEVFASLPAGKAVLERKFYFLAFICLLEEPAYQPLEVGAVEFTLLNGIENTFHRYINPGSIPTGYRFNAQQQSELTHKMPVEGVLPQDNYTRIYDDLFHFLSRGSQHIPPIHVRMSECERTEGCLKWLAQNAGRPNQLKRIYELEGLILDLDAHLRGHPQNFMASKQIATDLISTTFFDWETGTRCDWHEKNETKYCALGTVNRYCYCMADYYCQNFDIPITENHIPAKPHEVCYTLIPSNNKMPSRSVNSRRPDDYKSEDIADRVAQKLRIEMKNRQLEEEAIAQTESERKQHEEEQKKRWLALRGSPVKNEGEIENNPKSLDDNYIRQISPNINNNGNIEMPNNLIGGDWLKPQIVRGRGRGVANINLRRPGQPPAANIVSSSNVVKPPPGFSNTPPPGFGRGTKMFNGDFDDYKSKLWAGSAPPPHPSEAPEPPLNWMK